MTSPTAPPSLTPAPDFPALADRATGTYNSKAYAWAQHWGDTGGPEVEALAENSYTNAVAANEAATTASSAQSAAANSATTASGHATTASNAATTASGHATTAGTAATTASAAATTASGHATTASNASTQAQASAASAQAIVLGVSTGMPSIRPSFLADFANSRAIDPRITITRASTAYRVNQFGLLEQVASGVGRIDFNPVTLACLGLLIEESRTNLLTYSEQFDNAAWSKQSGASITANSVLAPDGSTSADTLTGNGAGSYLDKTVALTNGQKYTASFYAKAGTYTTVAAIFYGANFNSGGSNINPIFDLVNGVVISAGNAENAQITNAGNGWYRCSFVVTLTAASGSYTNQFVRTLATAGYAYIWRAKLEPGAFPTSPDQTVASTVTRAADSATVTGTSFSSWYRQDEGSVIVTARSAPGVGSVDQHVFSLTDSGGTNRITLYRNTSRYAVLVIDVGGVTQATLTSVATWADNTVAKIGVSFKAGAFALSLDGAAAVTAASGSVPTVDRLVLGNTVAGTRAFNGWIERFGFFPKQISNSELVAGATQ